MMANLYLVTCRGKDEDGPAGAYLVLANKTHTATALGAAAYADEVGAPSDVHTQELIGPGGSSVSLACAGLSVNGEVA